MEEIKKRGKGDLLKAARQLFAQKKELLMQADNLQPTYQRLLSEHQPKIDKLQEQADDLANKFKQLYDESDEARSSDERALAISLSIRGREVEGRCEAINAQANVLRNELKAILDEMKSLRKKAKEAQIQIDDYCKRATVLRKTTSVRGFGFSGIMDNDDVEEFLDEFPQKIFEKIQSFKFNDQLIGDEDGTKLGNHHWNEKLKKYEIEIYREPFKDLLPKKIIENRFKKTIAHEIAHTIFRKFMNDTPQRWQWGKWYEESIKRKSFVRGIDPDNREDDFCECFAEFKASPQLLKEYDQRRFDFISEIYHNLEHKENL